MKEQPYANTIRELNNLLARQYAHLAANSAAHDRLFRDEARTTANAVQLRHRKQVRELSDAVRRLGGVPRQQADLGRLVPLGRIVFANINGDSHLVRAMRTNALHLQVAYERARVSELPDPILSLLARHVTELARERSWLELRHREVPTQPAKA